MNDMTKQLADNRRWWILANVSLGTFMATLDGSIANVALPFISKSFAVQISVVQWVVTAYLLSISALLPIVGKVSDMLGKSKIYKVGFLIFALGSALCSFSTTIGMLIAMRVLQAIGASFLMANSQAIVASIFSAEERGRALGIVGTVVSLGSLTGPALGGVLIGWFGWTSVFWINVPIGIVALLAAWKIMQDQKVQSSKEPFDYTGSLLFMAGMICLLYTISNLQDWTNNQTLFMFVLSLLLLVLFYIRERLVSFPMLDLTLYRSRTFAAGTTAALLSFVSLFCTTVMMPFYMQDVLKYSPQMTGYTMAAYPMVMAIVAPIAGNLSDRIGARVLTTSGLLLNAIGFVLLNGLSNHASVVNVGLHLAIFGLGQGLFQSPNNSSVMGSVPRQKLGIAGGVNALVRNVGMVLGISFSVTLFTYEMKLTSNYIQSLHTVFWLAAIVCVIGILFSMSREKNHA